MPMKRGLYMAAAALAFLAVGSNARANYDFNVSIVPGGVPSFTVGGTSITLVPRNGLNLSGTNTVALADISVANTTTPPATPDAVNFNYSLLVTVVNPTLSANTGVFTITGHLTGTVDSTTSNLDNTYTSVSPALLTIGGVPFSLNVGPLNVPNVFYSPATVNGTTGGLGGQIIPVPEPASLALLGTGGLGALGLFRRRQAKKA